MFKDILYAIRMYKKSPGFTLITLGVMTVGLGLAIYMFSIVNMLAFKELDITDYDRLVFADAVVNGFEQNGGSINNHDYRFIESRQSSFEVFSAYTRTSISLSDGSRAQRYKGVALLPQAFELLDGTKNLLMGRGLIEQDAIKGQARVAIIGHQVWQDYFSSDSEIIGKQANINGVTTTIVGVMNQEFAYPMNEQVWIPLQLATNDSPGTGTGVTIIGKMKPGVTRTMAQSELAGLAREIASLYPESNGNIGIHSRTLVKVSMDNTMPIIYVLVAATLFILILVVTNVGNLMFARASERGRELAIRIALGAPKSRIVRQMMMESLIICVIGGALGVILAGWALDLTQPIFMQMGGWLAPWWTFKLGMDELLAALILVVMSAFVIGLVPAFRATDVGVVDVLKDGAKTSLGKKEGKLSKGLISVEILLSTAILIVAGALILVANKAVNADYGVSQDGYLTARFVLFDGQYPTKEAKYEFHKKLIAALEQQPGIEKATLGSALAGRNSGRISLGIEGMQYAQGQNPESRIVAIDESYHEAFEVPLLDGRLFDGRDTSSSQKVAIVTETFVSLYFNGESAVGRRIKLNPSANDADWVTIVGVVAHVVHSQPFGEAFTKPAVYVHNAQHNYSLQHLAFKVSGDPYDYQQSLIDVAGKLDPNLPFYNVVPFDERLLRRVAAIKFVGNLFTMLGCVALLLAASGIYGVMSQNVTRRTQEFGIRRALGSTDKKIYTLLVRQSGLLLLIGGLTGAVIGFLGIKIISGQLMNLQGLYLPIYAVVITTITLATVFATLIPAKKVLQLEPNHALRYE